MANKPTTKTKRSNSVAGKRKTGRLVIAHEAWVRVVLALKWQLWYRIKLSVDGSGCADSPWSVR